ncbi:MAG: PAS domain S-box protein [Anaerolineales bacterium]|nr:PAS domain S-box protein [Anaerolineales bacterium]
MKNKHLLAQSASGEGTSSVAHDFLLEAITAVSASIDSYSIFFTLAEKLGQAVDATSAFILGWDSKTSRATVLAEYFSEHATAAESVSKVDKTFNLVGENDLTQLWFATPDITILHAVDPDMPSWRQKDMLDHGVKSSLLIPLLINDEMIGFADIWESRYHRDFLPDELALCHAIAQQTAVLLSYARLYQSERQRRQEAELLNEVAEYVSSTLDLNEVVQRTLNSIRRYLKGIQSCNLAVLEPNGEDLHLLAPWEVDNQYDAILETDDHINYRKTYACRVAIETRRPFWINDLRQYPFANARLKKAVKKGLCSLLYIPLLVKEDVLGLLFVHSWHAVRPFTAAEVRTCRGLVSQAAMAIVNARLFEETTQQAKELARLYDVVQQQADSLTREVHDRTAELEAERDRTLSILESAGEGIMLTNVNGSILYVNPALEKQTGYHRSELLDQNPRIFNSGQESVSTFQSLWRTIMNGNHWSGEVINKRKDGSFYNVSLTITPLHTAGGELDGFVSVHADITRLKEVERIKSDFTSTVTHELRTPLTSIKTYLSLLERGKTEKRDHYMQVLHDETDRLTRLIENILDISRLETASPYDSETAVDVSDRLVALMPGFYAEADKRGITLREQIAADLPRIRIAGDHFDTVLTNVMTNAYVFMLKEHGEVTLTVTVENQEMRIDIIDNGIGIPEEELPHLFERFFRGKITKSEGIPGTGLGLSVVESIVNRYHGRIQVDSQSAQGTRFSIWFPIFN